MKKSIAFIAAVLVLAGCNRSQLNSLKSIEKTLEKDPALAERSLDSIDTQELNGKSLALYSILRTQVDYVMGKEIESDSIPKIATSYWRHDKKGYYPAMSWYSLGCAYSSMKKDPEAIYALLKAKELFTDTLSTAYADNLYLLGIHYNNRALYDDAIETFNTCRRLYLRIPEQRKAARAFYNMGLAYYEKKDYNTAQYIFEELLSDAFLDPALHNACYLQLAHVENATKGIDEAERVLELVDIYLAGCTTEKERVPGYALKGIGLYYVHKNDSAFAYLEKAHRLTDDLSIKILAIKGLEWVATHLKQYQAAWNAELLNKQYQEERAKQLSQSEITQIRLEHNDEIQNQRYHSKVSRIVLTGISLLVIVIAVIVIVIIQRDRRREAYYLQKYDDLIHKQMEEKASSEGNRLSEACEAFRTGIAFNLVNDVAMQHRSFRQEERDVVVHDINLYFAALIANLREEAGKLSQQEINLIFCTLLGFDQDIISDIMCTSRSNMRSIKSRLKSRISADTFQLYFKE